MASDKSSLRGVKFTLERANDGKHKWVGIFTDEDGKQTRTKFGSAGMTDYTLSKDKLRRANYLSRHRARENWNDPKSAGALSRWLLWGDSTSLQQNVASFRRRFSLS
jgi:hypothetical protein